MAEEQEQSALQKLMERYGVIQEKFAFLGGYEIEANIMKVANGLQVTDLFPRVFTELSGGEQTKVSLAYMLLQKPDLLLLDEPTNHLDLFAVEWLEKFLKEYNGTVMVISHDRYFLDEVVTKILIWKMERFTCTIRIILSSLRRRKKDYFKSFKLIKSSKRK